MSFGTASAKTGYIGSDKENKFNLIIDFAKTRIHMSNTFNFYC